MAYKIVNRNIRAGLFADAQDRIERSIQPFLDEGSKKGWRLHSFQVLESITDGSKINVVFIWETPDR